MPAILGNVPTGIHFIVESMMRRSRPLFCDLKVSRAVGQHCLAFQHKDWEQNKTKKNPSLLATLKVIISLVKSVQSLKCKTDSSPFHRGVCIDLLFGQGQFPGNQQRLGEVPGPDQQMVSCSLRSLSYTGAGSQIL